MNFCIKSSISFALILFSINSFGQSWNYGVQGGLVLATDYYKSNPKDIFETLDLNKSDHILGFHLNAHIGFRSKGIWGLSFEPGYIMKGLQAKEIDVRVNLNYLQLPILSDFFISDKIVLSLGPEFAYLLSAIRIRESGKEEIGLEKFEVSSIIELGYHFSDRIYIGLRFGNGFTRTSKATFVQPDGEIKIYNRYYQLTCRYTF